MLVFGLLCILHFIVLLFVPNQWVQFLTKILPIAYLIQEFYRQVRIHTFSNKMIFAALLFSMLGDSLLSFDGLFVPGLGAFLVAQIFYSIGFSKGARLHLERSFPFYLLGIGLFVYLYSSLSVELKIPVLVYMVALTTMGWRASSRNVSTQSLKYSALGATIFLLSDALIALTQFGNLKIPNPQLWVMITYYSAQFLLYKSVRG